MPCGSVGPMLLHMPRRIVIAGGGVAALEACIAIRALGGDAVSPIVVAPNTDFSFRARSVGEPFGQPASSRVPLADVLGDLSIPHERAAISTVDPVAKVVRTVEGMSLPYQGLLVAVGGTPFPAYTHGISFDRTSGPPDAFDELLADIEANLVTSVAFVVPEAAGWVMPAYDLALQLAAWSLRHEVKAEIQMVTAETAPLDCFGSEASRRVEAVLDAAGIRLVCDTEPVLVSDTIMTAAGRWITADRIVSLPRLAGPRIRGLPCDSSGFIEVDAQGSVAGCPGVYAAGDGASHLRKQGGLAAQQADRAARALLREAGLRVPEPAGPPALRGALATPEGPLFLESSSTGYGVGRYTSTATLTPLWDPPGKVATCWLGPFLEGMARRRLAAFSA